MFAPQLRRIVLASSLFATVALSASGCGSKSDLAAVNGVVMLDGKPMPEALVEFLPDPNQGTHGPVSGGITDEEGRFHLVCHDKREGAVIGKHRVVVQDARSIPQAVSEATPVRPPPPKPSRILLIYGSVKDTPLHEEVKEGPQTITLQLKGKSQR